MGHLTSRDGTRIAYERQGGGPAVVLVTGNLDDGTENAPLATELAPRFTVFNYNRRGRGESGDGLPYAMEREIEDIDALITEAGGVAHLFGISSGGALVLEAAAAGVPAERIAVYEVPYSIAEDARERWLHYVEELGPALAEGRRRDAVELFMHLAGSSASQVAEEFWPGLLAIAPTLAYDAAALRDGLPPGTFAAITQPVLVATGGGLDFYEQAGDALAAILPKAERVTVDQGHVVDAKTFAPVLSRFFQVDAA